MMCCLGGPDDVHDELWPADKIKFYHINHPQSNNLCCSTDAHTCSPPCTEPTAHFLPPLLPDILNAGQYSHWHRRVLYASGEPRWMLCKGRRQRLVSHVCLFMSQWLTRLTMETIKGSIPPFIPFPPCSVLTTSSSMQHQKILSIYPYHLLWKSPRKLFVWHHLRNWVTVKVKCSLHLRWVCSQLNAVSENIIPRFWRTHPTWGMYVIMQICCSLPHSWCAHHFCSMLSTDSHKVNKQPCFR